MGKNYPRNFIKSKYFLKHFNSVNYDEYLSYGAIKANQK